MSEDEPDAPATGTLPARAREDADLTPVQLVICEQVMLGKSMRKICSAPEMPSITTVFRWLATEPQFYRSYMLAKQLLAEAYAEEVVEISDDAGSDWVEGEDGKVLDHEHVQRSKLRVDARKWAAAKLSPKRFGDATAVRLSDDGLGGERRKLSEDEVAVRLAAILHSASKRKA